MEQLVGLVEEVNKAVEVIVLVLLVLAFLPLLGVVFLGLVCFVLGHLY